MTVAMWTAMFLAEKYGRLTLTLEEVAEQIGLSPGTIRNRRVRGEFAWLRADGRALSADVSDVVAYLERRRTEHAVPQGEGWHRCGAHAVAVAVARKPLWQIMK